MLAIAFHPLTKFDPTMSQSPLNLGNFDNTDSRVLTIFIIGTPEKVSSYIRLQHQHRIAEAGTWSRPQPMPNCPGKVVSVLNRVTGS